MSEHWNSGLLCETCKGLHRVKEDFPIVDLGTVAEVQSKHACPVCRIVLSMVFPEPATEQSPRQNAKTSSERLVLKKMGRDAFFLRQDRVYLGELDYLFPNYEINSEENWWYSFKDTPCQTANSLDYEKVRRWIDTCESDHIRCKTVLSERKMGSITETFFIDTFDNCLVYKDTTVRYLALSYVWGNAVKFTTNSSNRSGLQQYNALMNTEPPLNTVFKDAIELARQLGERYLWIDALCIPQDDGVEKRKLIANMDSIYALAALTIIALSADNADSPLPGIQRGTRLANIASVQLGDAKNIEGLPDRYIAVRPSLTEFLEKNPYNYRGWTFQESCLSRRCLIFTKNETFFHCDSGMEGESGAAPRSDDWPGRGLLISSLFETDKNFRDVEYQYNLYTNLVIDFSNRNLKDQKDTLDAIEGIFAVLSKLFGWRFISGIPIHLMNHALLWRAGSKGQPRNPHFPSWSWAGWIGQSQWNYQSIMDPVWIPFETKNTPLVPLQSSIEILPGDNLETENTIEAHRRSQVNTLLMNVDSVQADIFHIRDSRIIHNPPRCIPLTPYREIWTTHGLRCGIIYDFPDEITQDYRLLALSRSQWTKKEMVHSGRLYDGDFLSWFGHICDDEKLEFSDYCLMNVMLVVTQGTRTERVGIGFIHHDVWSTLATTREMIELH